MGRFYSRVTTIRFEDSGGLGMTVGPGEGNFSFDPVNYGNTTKSRVLDRGRYDCHIETEDLEQSFSIDTQLKNESLTEAALDRLQDFLLKQGNFAAAVTVNANPDIWAWKCIITMVLGGVTAVYTLPNCIGDFSFAEGTEGHTIGISGTNNGPILRDGLAVPVN